MIKLSACPFCGGEAELTDHGDGRGGWMISCKNNCGVLMAARPKRSYPKDVDIHQMGKEMTVKTWNKRFVTKDKNGKDVFAGDEVLVYRGKKNIGEGYVFFNDKFLWWTVNNSNQDNDREYPQDWSQLTLCDVDIELIEDKDD